MYLNVFFSDLVPWITCNESSTPVILDGNYGWVEKQQQQQQQQQQPSVCSLQGYKVA